MFLKQQKSEQVKSGGYADGRMLRQLKYIEEVSSPVVSIGSVILTSVIDLTEEQDVA
jgi:hypothetical protein